MFIDIDSLVNKYKNSSTVSGYVFLESTFCQTEFLNIKLSVLISRFLWWFFLFYVLVFIFYFLFFFLCCWRLMYVFIF